METRILVLALATAGLSLSGLRAAEINPHNLLSDAIRNGNTEQVSVLLDNGADPNAVEADGTPLLMSTVVYCDAKTVRLLLDHGANPNAKNPAGATALIWAAGDPQKALALLAHGADPNVRTALGRTALLATAAHDGSAPVVKSLLAANVDTMTPDHLPGPPNIFSGGGSPTPIIEAAKARDGKALRMLIDAGTDVNARDHNGGTALTEATVLGNADNAQALLKAGANVNVTVSSWKYTPLFLAIIQNNPDLVKTMLAKGADVNAKDSTGSTPLMWAAYSEVDDPSILKMLRSAGAEVNVKNSYGESALTWAKRNGETSIVRLLKQWGAQ
jgi:uncharacterized protein